MPETPWDCHSYRVVGGSMVVSEVEFIGIYGSPMEFQAFWLTFSICDLSR